MSDLIYDRTQEDVDYALANMDSDEYLKGAYNYIDLNRLEEWVFYLKYKLKSLGYEVSELNPKMSGNTYEEISDAIYQDYIDLDYDYYQLYAKEGDWEMTDFPTYEEISRIVNNIELLRSMFSSLLSDVAYINFSGTLNYIQANTIEKILYLINNKISKVNLEYQICGVFYCGDDNFLY